MGVWAYGRIAIRPYAAHTPKRGQVKLTNPSYDSQQKAATTSPATTSLGLFSSY